VAIDDVVALVPPPANPNQIGTLDEWRAVERELGLAFPTDYQEFVLTYGTGMFATEYAVFNPFAGTKYLQRVRYLCEIEADFRRKFPNRVPYAVYPEPGGVFLWGNDQNGNYYGWLTAGPPDRWPVVTNEVRGHGYREHGCSMTDYLAGVLRGQIDPLIGDFPGPDCFVFVA
jgi:hypothetical protein